MDVPMYGFSPTHSLQLYMQCTSYQHSPAVIYLNLALLQEGSSRRYLSLEVAVPGLEDDQGQSSGPHTIAPSLAR